MENRKTVLIVDDSKPMLELIRRSTSLMGLNPFAAHNVIDAIEILENTDIDLVITDMNMPGIGGEQLVRYISQHYSAIPVLVVTGYPDVRNAVTVMQLGAIEYLIKPFTMEELESAISKVLEKQLHQSPTSKTELNYPDVFHGMIGKSDAMKRLFSIIDKTKNNLASVLITGESGTGKEMVARAIHYNSKNASAPFVAVNCGAIPDQLLESELFGHLKGAFTGANQTRVGFFQAANGGTLFLDEITNATPAVQAKLLRAIQEKEVTMLGDVKSMKVNLRLISASNVDFQESIHNKDFREDLYYRLNVITIHIPALRERTEDIPLLVQYFNQRFSKEYHKPIPKIPKPVMQLLEVYAWPGNVRELENLIHRLVILCENEINMELIPDHMKMNLKKKTSTAKLISLKEMEKQHILHVLSQVGNNKSKAAAILGIDRKTLRSKLNDE
jgi:DNA-binding NtrC family response regulator